MPDVVDESPDAAVNSAVINPYALAEVVVGRPLHWERMDDKRRVLEEILQTPYEELFDPMYDSPLYLGFRLNEKLELEQVRPPLLDVEPDEHANDLDRFPELELTRIKRLGDLGPIYRTDDISAIAVDRAELVDADRLRLELSRPGQTKLERLARVFTKDVVATVAYVPEKNGKKKDFTPPNGTWGDFGTFFNEAAEFFDPIQGAVANCYLIAAMASVAWARPYMVTHMTRATGTGQPQFTNMIRFRDIDSGNAVREVEVTDAIPLATSSGNPIYCRSSEAGEIWPGVYEKAFAKWKTGATGDRPDITATAWGDCVRAAAELTGFKRHYFATTDHSGLALWNKVRENSIGGRTFNPMVAATYSSGQASEKKIVYGDANLVASHCYSVLGWDYRNGKRYIILRNPWGSTEATKDILSGTVLLYDVSWWRPIVLTDPDGVFAIQAETFKTYFRTLGLVKP